MSQIDVEPQPVVVEVQLTVPEHWSAFGALLMSMVVRRSAQEAFSVRLSPPHEPDERPLLRLWPVKRKAGIARFSVVVTTPECFLRPEHAHRSFRTLLAMISAYLDSVLWADDLPDFQMPRVTVNGVDVDLPRPYSKE